MARERAQAKAKRGLFDAHVMVHRRQPKPPKPAVVSLGLHDAHVLVVSASPGLRYRLRYRSDPDFALAERMRRQLRKKLEAVPNAAEIVRSALHGSGRSNRVEASFGYTITALRAHLEAQFASWMTWANHSKHGWHVDHILPKRCFDLTKIEGVRAYWALSNLRPLAAAENLRKGARVEALC